MNLRRILAVAFLPAVLAATSCSSMYYSTMESLGREKREILVSRVKAASSDQTKAKEQFADALEQFQVVLGKSGGDLESKYRKLESEFKSCQSRAGKVRERIDSIENVSKALFKEWEKELDQYKSADLRATSERRLAETRRQYETMITAMTRAADKMDPVLGAFNDRVLFLKHNLNAQAITSLQADVAGIEDDVARLIADMEKSIAESAAFIERMDAN